MQIFELKPVLIFSLESSKPRKSKDTKLQESFLDMEQQFQDITGNSFISCFRAILFLFSQWQYEDSFSNRLLSEQRGSKP